MMQTLSYRFEELPDFWEGEFRSGFHNGVAEISYSFDGAWYVSAISIECVNAKFGPQAASKMVPLMHHDVLREKLEIALDTFCRDYIQDEVIEAIGEDMVAAE